MSDKKEEKQLSLFSNDKHEDLFAIFGAAFVMIIILIL